MTEPGKKIIGRFATVYIFIVILMLTIIYNIAKIQTVERENWLKLGAKMTKKTSQYVPTEAIFTLPTAG